MKRTAGNLLRKIYGTCEALAPELAALGSLDPRSLQALKNAQVSLSSLEHQLAIQRSRQLRTQLKKIKTDPKIMVRGYPVP